MPVLTEREWTRLVPLLKNIEINRQQAAYNRLVAGMTLVKAGEPFGYSKQDVHVLVKAVLRWWEKLNSLPDKPKPPRGWVLVEFLVPQNRVDEVRRVVEALCPPPRPSVVKGREGASSRRVAERRRAKAAGAKRPKAA